MKTTFFRAAVLGVFVLASQALAAGSINGRVSGYVYDPTHSPLAEVPITISGPALMSPQSRVTGDDGKFSFEELPPGGDYTIEVNVPGFTPIRQKGIEVLLGQTTPADVNLTVMTETSAVATYEIVEKANPVLNPDTAETGAVITSEKAEATPEFHQVETMPQQVAGVGPGNRPSTRGGFARWGKFYVDGMDTTDITDGSITAPMNFDAIENFEIITGSTDAQYNALGMVENVVTKNGSNTFKYDVNVTWSPPAFSSKVQVAPNQPDYYQEYVNSSTSPSISSFFSPVVNLGGPIVKDKLWFFISGQLNRSVRETSILIQNQPLENRPTTTWTELARLKLTWQATSRDRLSVAFNYDHNLIDNAIANSTTALSAESRTDRGGYFVILNYDHSFSDNVLFMIQAGTTSKLVGTDPEHEGVAHFDITNRVGTGSSEGVGSNGYVGNFLHESKQRFQFDPTLSIHLGNNQLKFGIQTAYQRDAQITGVTGTQSYTDRGGVCDPNDPSTTAACFQRTDFYNDQGLAAPLTTTASVINISAFAQDTWTIGRHLTLIPGIRLDTGELYGDNGRHLFDLVGVGPRLSATWDIGGDRKNIIVAHAGRSNDVGNVYIAQHANPSLTSVLATYANGAFPSCAINAAPCTTSGGLAGRVVGPNIVPPSMDEISFGYHREVADDVAAGVDLTYRRYNNLWSDQETNRIYDQTGTKIVGYENGINQSITQAVTPASAYRQYEGMDLWVNGRPGRWDLYAAYTLSFTTGTVDDYFDGYLNNPRETQWYNGYASDDRRHTLKASASYAIPEIGLDFGGKLQFRTGNPLWEAFTNPADASQQYYRSPRGTGFAIDPATGAPNFNDPNTWVSLRNPNQFIIDLQARYNVGRLFGLHKEPKIELVGLFVNVLNTTDVQNISSTYSTRNNRFGYASSRQSPFQAELLLRVRN